MKCSIRTKIILMILAILLPFPAIMGIVSNRVFQNARALYRDSEKQNLAKFVSNMESGYEAIINYLQAQTLASEYIPLAAKEDSLSYRLSKTALWSEISGLSTFFQDVSVVYAFFSEMDDCFAYYSTDEVKVGEYQILKPFIKSESPYFSWQFVQIEGQNYFHYRVHGRFDMGILIKESSVLKQLERSDGVYYSIENLRGQSIDAQEAEDSSQYEISIPFLVEQVYLVQHDPKSLLTSTMPPLYQWMLFIPPICIITIILYSMILQRIIIKPIRNLGTAFSRIRKGESDYRIQKIDNSLEFAQIQVSFNKMMDVIRDLRIREYEQELENQRAQLINLQLQLNPHFLMNSLNAIYSLTEVERYGDIQPYVSKLVQYLRYSVGNSEAEVELYKEIEFIESYASIQRLRYPDRFNLIYNIDDSLMNQHVLRMIIENLVENSIRHGYVRGRTIEIIVTVVQRNDRLILTVCDNGKGIAEETAEKIRAGEMIHDSQNNLHVGLWNCFRRLKLFYHGNVQWNITTSPGEGTQIYIDIPILEDGNECVDCG